MSMLMANDWQSLVEGEKGSHYNWIEIDYERAPAEKAQVKKVLKKRSKCRRPIDENRSGS